jgi:hypothetical protein
MQKALRIAATLVVLAGGMSLTSARPAHAGEGCPSGLGTLDCEWCGDGGHGSNCTLYGCEWRTDGTSCSCKYDCTTV